MAKLDRDRFPVDPWRLVETRYSDVDTGVTESIFALANGYLGLRGNQSEGRRAYEHGTFINGLHETWPIHHAEKAYGFAEVGQTIVNAPDSKTMRVYIDDEPLAFDVADIHAYERVLDLRTGVLSRRVTWETPSGKTVQIDTDRLVSFTDKHLAVMTVKVTVLNADAAVSISCQLINRQDGENVYGGTPTAHPGATFDPRKAERLSADRVLIPQEYSQADSRATLSYRVANSGMTVAVVADHVIETENAYDARALVEPDIAKNIFRVHAKAGVPITVTKIVNYHSSRAVPVGELIDRSRQGLDRVKEHGIASVYEAQRGFLDDFWARSDVRISGHDDVQQAARWCIWQLAQAGARADGLGVPSKGLTGSGYSGHYFWDTEIYMLPFMTYTSPGWARNALRMRTLMLPAARKRAVQLNEAGALFPWRTINGEEASAYYAAGTAQYHINADVTYALAKYVRATGDDEFLWRDGIGIAVETARLWRTLGFWRQGSDGDSFHIHGVTGPDEYTAVVNDNLFTNVMARFNLRYAVREVRRMAFERPAAYRVFADRVGLADGEVAEWERAAEAMHIGFSGRLGIHPQDSLFLEREVWDLENTPADRRPLLLHYHPLVIYRFQVLKQADVVLALFLQGSHFSPDEKLADFEYYDPLTTGDSTLSAVVQSILAAEVGYQDLALEYFTHALYVDLGNLHKNSSDGIHAASAGGVWTALVSGFGGMRDYFGELSFDPRLPVSWPELSFELQWRGTPLTITVRRHELRVRAGAGNAVTFQVRGTHYTVEGGGEVVVPLADQGPVRHGRPTVGMRGGLQRDDGTLIQASLPSVTSADVVEVEEPDSGVDDAALTESIPIVSPAPTGSIPVVPASMIHPAADLEG